MFTDLENFDEDYRKMMMIQIHNSLELGWKRKDILLFTNFPYEYRGITAKVINKRFGNSDDRCSKKMPMIVHLLYNGYLKDDLYWYHDIDAYQLEPITEKELGLEEFDLGLTDYGRKPNWQMGSFFFRKDARDILKENASRIKPGLDKNGRRRNDEYAMIYMTDENWNNMNPRIKRMNYTYNFGMRKVKPCYDKAFKPIKVLHFHAKCKILNTLAIAMYGKNHTGKPLMNERLIKLFKKYGIT